MEFEAKGIKVYDGSKLSDSYIDKCFEMMDSLIIIHFSKNENYKKEFAAALEELESQGFKVTHAHIYYDTKEITVGIKRDYD